MSELSTTQTLQFDGIFQGRESEIRITPDNMISIFDFIKVAGGQTNSKSTWERILNQHKHELEVVAKCDYFQFEGQGQRKTPVISVAGMVKLLFWLPGETAKKFRSNKFDLQNFFKSIL